MISHGRSRDWLKKNFLKFEKVKNKSFYKLGYINVLSPTFHELKPLAGIEKNGTAFLPENVFL